METGPGGIVQSLLDEVDRAAVDRFLSAVDSVMNSNTLLLKVEAGQALTVDNRQGLLDAYLRSDLFEQMMREADRRREWYNLSDFITDPDESESPAQGSPAVGLLREGFRAAVTPLGEEEFSERLHWMLSRAPSPYNLRLPADEADRVVGGLPPRGAGSGGGRRRCHRAGVGVRLGGARLPALVGVLHGRAPTASRVLRRVRERYRHALPPGVGLPSAADERLAVARRPARLLSADKSLSPGVPRHGSMCRMTTTRKVHAA